MNYPLLSEYIEAIKLPEDNFEQLKYLRPVLDNDGQPVMSGGNFAVVFKMKDEQTGKFHAVKCFLKEQEGRAEAYRLITEELEYVHSLFLTPIKYLDKELFVDSNTSDETEFPVLLMDWVEGVTLDEYIREHINDQYKLSLLAYQFSRLAMWLLPQPFAHGDLKPDNILVRDDGTLVLVDYDGMYVPAMKGQKARELGSPHFRHPSRTENDFDEHIDDFSFASILLSLKAIALQPSLLKEFGATDRLLFSEKDYHDWSKCLILNDLNSLCYDNELKKLYGLFLVVLSINIIGFHSNKLIYLSLPKALYPKDKLITLKFIPYYIGYRKLSLWDVQTGRCINKEFLGDMRFADISLKHTSAIIFESQNGGSSLIYDMSDIINPSFYKKINHIGYGYFSVIDKERNRFIINERNQVLFDNRYIIEQIVDKDIFWIYDKTMKYNGIIDKSEAFILPFTDKVILSCSHAIAFLACNVTLNIKDQFNYNSINLKIKLYDISKKKFINQETYCKVTNFSCGYAICMKSDGVLYKVLQDGTEIAMFSPPQTFIEDHDKDYLREYGWKLNSFYWMLRKDNICIFIEKNDKNVNIHIYEEENEVNILKFDNKEKDYYHIPTTSPFFFRVDLLDNRILHIGYYGGANDFSKYGSERQDYWTDDFYCDFNGKITDINKCSKDVSQISKAEIELLKNVRNIISSVGETYNYDLILGGWEFYGYRILNESLASIYGGCAEFTQDLFYADKKRIYAKRYFDHAYEFDNRDVLKTAVGRKEIEECIEDSLGGKYSHDNCKLLQGPKNHSLFSVPSGIIIIGDKAFYGYKELKEITLPNSTTDIGSAAFWRTGIEEFHFPPLVKVVSPYMFWGCTKLQNVIFNQNELTICHRAFAYCRSLTNIILPNKIRSIGYESFLGCESIQSIYIPKNVQVISEHAFSNCKCLKTIKVDKNNPNYDSRLNCNAIIESATNRLIAGCSLTTIPNDVTSIGNGAFKGCSSLQSIVIPDGVTSIGHSAFDGCKSLQTIVIPNGVTNIEDYSFRNCISLKSIVIPGSVTSIGRWSFDGCKSLQSIFIPRGERTKYQELLPHNKDKFVELVES